MPLSAGCPRCAAPVAGTPDLMACPEHGIVPPLWRPAVASYEAFIAHLDLSGGFPTYLPWPLVPDWRITDFGVVAGRASYACVSGTSPVDGPVDLLVISEEAGIGLGGRWAGTDFDPGLEIGDGPACVRVRLGSQPVPLWPVSTTAYDGEWDRSVLAGEGGGRWLWMVLRPASALLMLLDGDWLLRDVSDLGPGLVELPFGDRPPAW